VLFTSYGGTEVKLGGEEYLIMEERDILGVIEE
jgi:chaperonin GroES